MKFGTANGQDFLRSFVTFWRRGVGIELYRFVDFTDVVDFIEWNCIAATVKNVRNAALGDVQVT
jgi:hypothetical protein